MNRRISNAIASLVSFGALVLLASCDGGGSGGIRLFFGIRGDDKCDRVTMAVDLPLAGAVIARNGDGSLACEPSELAHELFCEMRFEDPDADLLRVAVEGCDIPSTSMLFSCRFVEADLSRFEPATSALCDCGSANLCDSGVPVCVNGDENVDVCEDCNNGSDDDGDADTDCDDQNCRYSGFCSNPSSTSSTSTQQTTTTSDEVGDVGGSPATASVTVQVTPSGP